MNDRFSRNQDGDTDARTGSDFGDDAFRSFAVWVNNPVSDTSHHYIPDGLQEAVDDVGDPKERQRLRAVLQAYERRELSPRDFVRLIMESDEVDFFDPLSTPEGWGSHGEDGFDGPTEAESGGALPSDLVVGEPCPACDDGELTKGVDGEPLEPSSAWCDTCDFVVGEGFGTPADFETRRGFPYFEVVVCLLIAALFVAVYVVTSGVV